MRRRRIVPVVGLLAALLLTIAVSGGCVVALDIVASFLDDPNSGFDGGSHESRDTSGQDNSGGESGTNIPLDAGHATGGK